MLLGLLLACGEPQPPAPSPELSDRVDFSGGRNDPPGEPQYGGILRWAERAEPTTLDPAYAGNDLQSARVAMQIFESLLTYDVDLNLRPALAQAWQVQDGGRRYRFKLRPRAVFHDDRCFPGQKGRRVVAQDVKYSLERILDPSLHCNQASLLEQALYGNRRSAAAELRNSGVGIHALGSEQLEVVLAQPHSSFLHLLTMVFTSVVPREAVQYYGEDFGRHPVGSGPFVFHRWLSEQQIELQRHSGYGVLDLNRRRLPYLDGALIRFLGSPDVELLEFQAGTLDLLHSISASAFPSIVENGSRVRAAFRNYRVLATENFGTELLGVNMQHPLLGSNRKLRQALALAVDREALTEVLLSGRAIPATGLLPRMSVGPDKPRTESGVHDPPRARQLLEEAGFPGGKGLPVFRLLFNASPTVERLVTYLQAALVEIGIQIRMLPVPFSEFLERLQSGDFDLYRDHLAADHAAADAFFGYFYGPYSAPQSINITRFQDSAYDSLFDRLQRQSQEVQRSRLQTQLQSRLDRAAPAVFLFHPLRFRLQIEQLKNSPMSPLGHLDLKNAWLDPEWIGPRKPQ